VTGVNPQDAPGHRLLRWLPAVALVLNAGLILFSATVTLRRFPASADEYSYLLQAELFARGRLSAPSPEPREFFDFIHVINNGRFFSKYPPGWPAILALGASLGIPWIVNPAIGLATMGLLYVSARRHFSLETARLVLLMMVANPFFILNSASHFSHPSCLLAVALTFHFYFCWLDQPDARRPAVLFGLFAGLGFLIRPLTATALIAPLAAHFLFQFRDRERRASSGRALVSAAIPSVACLVLFLGYNWLQTGNPFLQPFNLYDPIDHPGWPSSFFSWLSAVGEFVFGRLWKLNLRWIPFSLLFLGVFAFRPALRSDLKARLLLAGPGLLILTLSFYATDGGNRYGPRYVYEIFASLAIVGALAFRDLPRLGLVAAAAAISLNVHGLVVESNAANRSIRRKMEVYARASELGPEKAVIFLRTGSGDAPPGDLTRNGVEFDGPILYVLDRGDQNGILVDEFPDRRPYVYEDDAAAGRGTLSPLRR